MTEALPGDNRQKNVLNKVQGIITLRNAFDKVLVIVEYNSSVILDMWDKRTLKLENIKGNGKVTIISYKLAKL